MEGRKRERVRERERVGNRRGGGERSRDYISFQPPRGDAMLQLNVNYVGVKKKLQCQDHAITRFRTQNLSL